jgi:hypothetical protein
MYMFSATLNKNNEGFEILTAVVMKYGHNAVQSVESPLMFRFILRP